MGNALPYPVKSKVVEYGGSDKFRLAVASMNGYRQEMEDAHMVFIDGTRAVFGVFDGHSGDRCSSYCANTFTERVAAMSAEPTDEEIQKLVLEVDKEYIASGRDSGSTATLAFVSYKNDNEVEVIVANVGDSRIVVVKKDGETEDMTEDHKPTLPEEKKRIEGLGGHVKEDRVNGMLAMSRAMGDSEYKKGTGGQLDQLVIPLPDIKRVKIAAGDTILLYCDGIVEQDFTNQQVSHFVTEALASNGDDIADTMCALCDAALRKGSGDNMTSMIVQLKDGTDVATKPKDFRPGPYHTSNSAFLRSYRVMAEKGGLTFAEALSQRHDDAVALMEKRLQELRNTSAANSAQPDEAVTELRNEIALYRKNPAGGNFKRDMGPEERKKWFAALAVAFEKQAAAERGGLPQGAGGRYMLPQHILQRIPGLERALTRQAEVEDDATTPAAQPAIAAPAGAGAGAAAGGAAGGDAKGKAKKPKKKAAKKKGAA